MSADGKENGANSSRQDTFANENWAAEQPNREDSVTLQEILDEEESLEADAAAVLGASDAKRCSYVKVIAGRNTVWSVFGALWSELRLTLGQLLCLDKAASWQIQQMNWALYEQLYK